MYEYLVENLISYSQVDGNLRRTADRGLVSELYRRQMNALALKYFGVDSNGNYTENKEDIVAYRCPYSGEIISDLSTAHLEHILPVSSNGGTVLFNCIPILDKVNLSKRDEANLLVWWQEQNYFNYDRLERLIQYMLEAYTLAFKEPTEEELYDYDNSLNSDDYIENDDLSIDLKDKTSNQTNINIQQTITYYQLINDLINELSKNRDVSKYNSQLNSLKEQNTFGNIDELEKVINAVQTVFKETLGESSKSYLSYSLNIDMNKLLSSLKTKDYESEIRARLSFINELVKDNNKEINDYFESLADIEEENILYKYNPHQEDITYFLNSIRISHKSKIRIFIEMLSNPKYTNYVNGISDENNIFVKNNKVPFEGYEHINGLNTSRFWTHNSDRIIQTINTLKNKLESKEEKTFEEEQKLIKLNKALKAIDDYNFVNQKNLKYRIEKFIEMLSNPKYTNYVNGTPDESNIFSAANKISFEGYEHINGLNTSRFWTHNSDRIIQTINTLKNKLESKEEKTFEEEQKLIKLNKALKAIDDYNFVNKNNLKYRIEEFIEMLSNPKYTNYVNGTFDGNNIFGLNKIPFEGYEHIQSLNTSYFWADNSDRIIQTINTLKNKLESKEEKTFEEEQKLIKLNKALKAIDDYNFVNQKNLKYRIEKFIEMLSNPKYTNYANGTPDENNIFAKNNKVPFEGYEHIQGLNTSYFWRVNSNKIIEVIYIQKTELENKENRTQDEEQKLIKLNKALKAIDDYNFVNKDNLKYRIEKFIEMLSNPKYTNYVNGTLDENNIFDKNNKVPFDGYEHIQGLNTSRFWGYNSDRIIQTINTLKNKLESKEEKTFEEEQKLIKLNKALKAINDYNFVNKNNLKYRIEKFIEMLSNSKYTNYINNIPDDNNIFSATNKIPFEGYEHIDGLNTSQFWNHYSIKNIIPLLFYNNSYNDAKYDSARNAVMEYLNYNRRRKQQPEFKNIDEYIDTLDKTKKDVKSLIELRDSLLLRKQQLNIENQELTEELNSSYRRAM